MLSITSYMILHTIVTYPIAGSMYFSTCTVNSLIFQHHPPSPPSPPPLPPSHAAVKVEHTLLQAQLRTKSAIQRQMNETQLTF